MVTLTLSERGALLVTTTNLASAGIANGGFQRERGDSLVARTVW
jgi:hypothetical protein